MMEEHKKNLEAAKARAGCKMIKNVMVFKKRVRARLRVRARRSFKDGMIMTDSYRFLMGMMAAALFLHMDIEMHAHHQPLLGCL